MTAAARIAQLMLMSAATLGLAHAGILRAQPPAAADGIFVTVATPITSGEVNRIRNTVDAAKARKLSKVVFDFNPQSGARFLDSVTEDFGPCLDLAEYIQQQHSLTTVAYVHQKVLKHSVLPVLACSEIAMSSSGVLGPVESDDNAPRLPRHMQAYRDFARPAREAIVMKMIDPSIVVREGRLNNAAYYFDERKQSDVVAAGVIGIKPEPVLPAGRVLALNQDDATRFGVCKLRNKESWQQVAEAYGLSGRHGDILQGAEPKAWKVRLQGEVNEAFRETIERRVRTAISEGANVLIFHFADCRGGKIEVAQQLAEYIKGLQVKDSKNPVLTIAYVPQGAPDVVTFLVFACREIVLTRAENEFAAIGDFSRLLNPPANVKRRGPFDPGVNIEAARRPLRDLAESQGISPLLVDGMFQPELELFRARALKGGSGERRIMTADELEAERNSKDPQWQAEEQIKHKGQLLKLNWEAAQRYGIARHVLDSDNIEALYAKYNLTGKVRDSRPDWLDAIAEFLRNPWVRFFLVVIGGICLVLELKIPGATAPGVIAALCFVLFFWSQAQLGGGEIFILAILLFLLGLVLIGIEVFVLPGFGFVGISGIVLMVVGLALATIERMPQSGSDWFVFFKTLTQFGAGLIVAAVGAILIARYLPNIPVANRIVLMPPTERGEGESLGTALPGMEQAAALLGAVGTAATMLRPAGMAKFEDQFVDVVTEGGFIPAGARVQVIEVEGNRIVVKEV